ncbi:hypothetical protein EMCRGX_G004774 [Ephydatia muelleri]
MDYDCLLFPVHTLQHWCLVVVYPQVHEIHCIDSLQQSNYDAINWICTLYRQQDCLWKATHAFILRHCATMFTCHSGIQDDTAKHGQSDCDDIEIDQTDQLGDDGDMDDEDDADESDEERTADPNFLVPTYENEPDPNDIFVLKWGKDHYFKYLPSLKRMPYTEEQCPFEREFIRKVVKEMEIDSALVFQSTLNPLKVLEIFHYLMETESDVKLTASVCTSRINRIIVWPEITERSHDTGKGVYTRVAEGQPACQAGLTGQGPGLTCQARGLAYQAGPRPP